MGEPDTRWFSRKQTLDKEKSKSPAFIRFFRSPCSLFVASLISWPVLLLSLFFCNWLDLPHLAMYFTVAICGLGFACSELSAVDCGQPFFKQHRRLCASFACWAVVGLISLWLFPFLF